MLKDKYNIPNSQYNACVCGKSKRIFAKLYGVCYKAEKHIGQRTKDEVSGNNWWAKRVPIAKHARRVFSLSDKPKECLICGYNKHYEVCHVKAIADYDNTITIEEINNIDNLVALCRNHHWEYDNGLILI